jgi:hypothetical protein
MSGASRKPVAHILIDASIRALISLGPSTGEFATSSRFPIETVPSAVLCLGLALSGSSGSDAITADALTAVEARHPPRARLEAKRKSTLDESPGRNGCVFNTHGDVSHR